MSLTLLPYLVWTVLSDTIYTLQDIKDDVNACVHSTAVRFRESSVTLLTTLTMLELVVLGAIGFSMQESLGYYILSWCINAVIRGMMLTGVDLAHPGNCM